MRIGDELEQLQIDMAILATKPKPTSAPAPLPTPLPPVLQSNVTAKQFIEVFTNNFQDNDIVCDEAQALYNKYC